MRNATRAEHSRFVIHSENICHLVQEEGVLFRPFSRLALPHFSILPETDKLAVIAHLKSYYQICLDVRATGRSLQEARFFTEKALVRLNLEIAPAHLDLIQNSHTVEIYNVDQVQIFRSFRFFEISSYTLEDLLCRKWYDIFDRKDEDNILFHKAVNEFYSMPVKEAVQLNLPEVAIKERDTLEKLTIQAKVEWFIPLFNKGEFAAVMLLVQARN